MEVDQLKETTVTSAASTTVSQKWKGEARRDGVPKILALLAHLFLLLATTLGNGARFRVQIKVNAWVVEKYHLFCSRF